jgi:hypothetical protein
MPYPPKRQIWSCSSHELLKGQPWGYRQGSDICHDEARTSLRLVRGNPHSPFRFRLIKKLRYLSGAVQLPSNQPYGGSLSLFGAKPMKTFESVFQRRKICEDRAVVKSRWTI